MSVNSLDSWSRRRDLNPRPSDYKSDALPTELRRHAFCCNSLRVDEKVTFWLCARFVPDSPSPCHCTPFRDAVLLSLLWVRRVLSIAFPS
jgi:hypothetical protein